LALACSTWKEFVPLTHYSSSKKTFEDSSVIARSHADYIYEKINNYNKRIDIEIEAKAKDLAVLEYRKNKDSLLTEYLEF
jgi:UV DNA damage repair endonuclease